MQSTPNDVASLVGMVDMLYTNTHIHAQNKSQHNSAESWPLTKPLQCVSLRVERRGDVLLLIFTYTHAHEKSSKLFALCTVDVVNKDQPLEHYVEAVLDSTRYFVVRVTDEKAGREALIGVGFRNREEAGEFRATLAKYEADISTERMNKENQ